MKRFHFELKFYSTNSRLKDKVLRVLQYIYIYVLMFLYYTVCYFTGMFYAVVRQNFMLLIDNTDSVFCIIMIGAI